MKYLNNTAALRKLFLLLLDGMGVTARIFFFTLLFALPLGLLIAFGRMSRRKWISGPVSLYILVMRGTPLMLQIFAVYFVLPDLLGANIGRMPSTIIAFSLNYAAYFAEIFRGGILSLERGQYEAGNTGLYEAANFSARCAAPGGQAHPAAHKQRGDYARERYGPGHGHCRGRAVPRGQK